jgi:hypothetical protein
VRGLTERQAEILAHIHTHVRQTGRAPTVREIGAAVGLSSSCTVQKHLQALRRKGHLADGLALPPGVDPAAALIAARELIMYAAACGGALAFSADPGLAERLVRLGAAVGVRLTADIRR